MSIPTYEQWQRDTSLGITKPRSGLLKSLDAAIEKYNKAKTQDNLWAIKNAFEDWKRSKGNQWQQSDRNRNGAVTKLAADLDRLDSRTFQITRMSMAELQALEYMKAERMKTIQKLFLDAHGNAKPVVFKAANLQHAATQAANNVKAKSAAAVQSLQNKLSSQPRAPKPFAVTGMGTSPGGGAMGTNLGAGRTTKDIIQAKLGEMVQKFFEVDSLTMLGPLTNLVMSIVAECATSAAPVIGHVKDGVSAISDWIEVGVNYYHRSTISRCSYAIELGAPAAAFSALEGLLQEEVKNAAISAGISTTSFAVKTGMVFVDGGAISGPVTGAMAALAEIAHKFYLLGMEYRATKDANKALKAGTLDITLFKTYPLMGCYLLNCATLSDIIPINCFATPGWMDYIEKLKKGALDNIIKQSEALIDKSPWEIKDMPKRPVGSSGGLLSEAMRFGKMGSPLSDLADLRNVGKSG
ncbi:MAG TPA: hypothetical protein VHD85_04710 [Terracidiphilus sp.]|nr:hypothetical protein [Terracidiphilus sp.]